MNAFNCVVLIVACLFLVLALTLIIVLLVKNKWLKDIYETVAVSIKEAEEKFSEPGSGTKKMEYVLAAVQKKCEELKIPFALLKLIITKLIETIVKYYNVIAK